MKIVEAPFEVRFEEIDPARARELLATQSDHGKSKNRNQSMPRIGRYADDMENGWWEVTHQGIAIDENGNLMDGQHRLRAVIESNTPSVMMVSIGVSRDVFTLMDGGLTRSAHSFLDGSYATSRAALGRTLLQLDEQNGLATLSNVSNGKFPAHRILRFLEDRSDIREYGEAFSLNASRAVDKKRGNFIGTTVAGLLVGGFLVERDKWVRWWEDVEAMRQGEGLPEGNPVRALYRSTPVGGAMTSYNYMRAIRAAVNYRDDKPMKHLREDMYREVQVW